MGPALIGMGIVELVSRIMASSASGGLRLWDVRIWWQSAAGNDNSCIQCSSLVAELQRVFSQKGKLCLNAIVSLSLPLVILQPYICLCMCMCTHQCITTHQVHTHRKADRQLDSPHRHRQTVQERKTDKQIGAQRPYLAE